MDTPCSKLQLSRPGSCGQGGFCNNLDAVGRRAGHCVCPKGLYGPQCKRLGSLLDNPQRAVVFFHFSLTGFEEFRGRDQDESVFIARSQLWWEDKRLLGVLDDGEYMHVTGDLQKLEKDGVPWIPAISFPVQDPPMKHEHPPIINATLKVSASITAGSGPTVLLFYEVNYRIIKEHLTSWHTFPFDKEVINIHMKLTVSEEMMGMDAVACCTDATCGLPAWNYKDLPRLTDAVKAQCAKLRGKAAVKLKSIRKHRFWNMKLL